ncbi:hypothetical protein DAPPUDRAFT_122491 [Daphnia pulex]|uniref:Uncharacterized protein n=1 Tax=Daphnia pulex TaxID=6669 RepID=E9I4C7_DAPPU|nr:hypothetical protein DAPPUDRAFT_122491 [Daphnia pulex]|eukprot:EFX61153.1 hypothetical protein DAPPUDRAFT_122491 [Daphnia pulex]
MYSSVLLILLFASLSSTLTIDTCNCSQPIEKGIIDLEDPLYCSHPEPVSKPKKVQYKLWTKNKDPITWTGYACTQWLSQKEISTNFLLSHDTTFKKQVLKVSANDCWASAQYPEMCDTNPMTKDGNTLKYLLEPEGEGYWMTTQSYKAKSCITQIIKLAKQCHDCPVTSPFGILANSSDAGFAKHNDLTIVWKKPDSSQEPDCDIKTIFTGSGNLTDGIKQSKLEDANSQIEIILNNSITRLCNNVTAFSVMGIPDTHIEIISEKRRRKRSIENKPSGILRLAHRPNRCLAYPRSEYITKMSAEICAISVNLTDRALYANTVDRGQSFQFLESGYILATEEDYCLHAWEPDQIAAKQCIDFGRHTTTKHAIPPTAILRDAPHSNRQMDIEAAPYTIPHSRQKDRKYLSLIPSTTIVLNTRMDKNYDKRHNLCID